MNFEKVRNIIAKQLELDAESITMDSRLIEDLKADSLDVVDILMSLQDEFDVEIPDEEVENIKTVGDLVHYLEGAGC